MKWGFIPFPRTGLTCGQIGTRPKDIKRAKQALEINHFLLMRKVLHSCVPAGKESSAGRMCASPWENVWGHPWCVESILCPGHWLFPQVPLLSWLLFLSSGSCQCRAPVLPAADLQRLVRENLGHLRAPRGLGVLVPARAAAKGVYGPSPG